MIRAIIALALAGLLAACEGGGDPVEQALRETAAAHQAAATHTTAEIETTGQTNGQANDRIYIVGMIAHHEAAVVTAQAALRDSRDPEIRRMAQAVVDTRTREIAQMKAWAPTVSEAN